MVSNDMYGTHEGPKTTDADDSNHSDLTSAMGVVMAAIIAFILYTGHVPFL